MISYKRDVRGTVIDNSWEGTCLEAGDQCPTGCHSDITALTYTCYECNIPATCEGQLSSHSLHKYKRARTHSAGY